MSTALANFSHITIIITCIALLIQFSILVLHFLRKKEHPDIKVANNKYSPLTKQNDPPVTSPYQKAVSLIKANVSIETITQECRLSKGEVELLKALN